MGSFRRVMTQRARLVDRAALIYGSRDARARDLLAPVERGAALASMCTERIGIVSRSPVAGSAACTSQMRPRTLITALLGCCFGCSDADSMMIIVDFGGDWGVCGYVELTVGDFKEVVLW